MTLGKLPVPERPTVWKIVGQGPIALAVGAGVRHLDIFTFLYLFSPLSPSLWETTRSRVKYCLKWPLHPNQPTNSMFRPRPSNRNKFRNCHKVGINEIMMSPIQLRSEITL